MHRVARLTVLFSLVALACLNSSCGGGGGGGGGGSGGFGAQGSKNADEVFYITMGAPVSPQGGSGILIPYILTSGKTSHAVAVQFRYSLNGAAGPFQLCRQGQGGEGTGGLLSTPQGTGHTFAWDAAGDGVALNVMQNNVVIRGTTSDNESDVTDAPISIDNVITAAKVNPPDGQNMGGDQVLLTYTLSSNYNVRQTYVTEYSLDGGNEWETATPGTGGSVMVNFIASSGGATLIASWNSWADGVAINGAVNNVMVRVRNQLGTFFMPAFTINVDNFVTAQILTPVAATTLGGNAQTFTGQIVSPFSISNIQIIWEYKRTSDTAFRTCTPASGSNPMFVVGGSFPQFLWNTWTDNIALAAAEPNTQVRIRVIANGQIGSRTYTNGVDNVITLTLDASNPAAGATRGGDVSFAVKFTSNVAFSNLAVTFQYAATPFTTFTTCQTAFGSASTSSLTSNPVGITHTFLHDSFTQAVGITSTPTIRYRVRMNTFGYGNPMYFNAALHEVTRDWVIDNRVTLSAITMVPNAGGPADEFGGDTQSVQFTLTSVATLTGLNCTYRWRAGTGGYSAADILPITATSGPGGNVNTVVWNTWTDAIAYTGLLNDIELRIEILHPVTFTQMDIDALTAIKVSNLLTIEVGLADFTGGVYEGADLITDNPNLGGANGFEVKLVHPTGSVTVATNLIDLTMTYSSNGAPGPFIAAQTGFTSQSLDDVEANLTGGGLATRRITWNSVAAGFVPPMTQQDSMMLKITATPGAAFGLSPVFSLNNNNMPFAEILDVIPPTGAPVGADGCWTNAIIKYRLTDANQVGMGNVSVEVRFSSSGGGGGFNDIALNTSLYDGATGVGYQPEGLTNLTVDADGEIHYAMWDTVSDVWSSNTVLIQIEVQESQLVATSGAPFTIDNAMEAPVLLDTVPGAFSPASVCLLQGRDLGGDEDQRLHCVYARTTKLLAYRGSHEAGSTTEFEGAEPVRTILNADTAAGNTTAEILENTVDAIMGNTDNTMHISLVIDYNNGGTDGPCHLWYVKLDTSTTPPTVMDTQDAGVIDAGVYDNETYTSIAVSEDDKPAILYYDQNADSFVYISGGADGDFETGGDNASGLLDAPNNDDNIGVFSDVAVSNDGAATFGRVHAVWCADNDIRYRVYVFQANYSLAPASGGEGNRITVEDDAGADKARCGIAYVPNLSAKGVSNAFNDEIHVVWVSGNGSQLRWAWSDSDGLLQVVDVGANGTEQLIASFISTNSKPEIAYDRQGLLYVALPSGTDGEGIRFAHSGPNHEFGGGDDSGVTYSGLTLIPTGKMGLVIDQNLDDADPDNAEDMVRDFLHFAVNHDGGTNNIVFGSTND